MKKFIVITAASLAIIPLWWFGAGVIHGLLYSTSLPSDIREMLTLVWFILLCIVMWKVSKKILKALDKYNPTILKPSIMKKVFVITGMLLLFSVLTLIGGMIYATVTLNLNEDLRFWLAWILAVSLIFAMFFWIINVLKKLDN